MAECEGDCGSVFCSAVRTSADRAVHTGLARVVELAAMEQAGGAPPAGIVVDGDGRWLVPVNGEGRC